ncbi:DUF3014 domain-containing protein [Idiomarina baltica]|jgi:hypothetical protein|uniref:DUF3014 domain-containing protein n=1 Tax=Idiomarina baltica TaxID=190892 RepID=UPI0023575B56|nr:DUF3014 domain-containing protein [Idiomarina baltica]|tara:strand:- start:2372 stop:3247 length:876 start_codon:yes stop_codon:yes gene_type:complete
MAEQDNYPGKESSSNTARWVVAVIIVAIIIGGVSWWMLSGSNNNEAKQTQSMNLPKQPEEAPAVEPKEPEPQPQPEPDPEPAATPEPTTEVVEEPEPAITLPDLNESTPTVLQELDNSGIEIQPLKSSQLIKDAVVIIDNLRNGMLVTDRTVVQRPDGRFSVIEVEGDLYIDEQSYQRYDPIVDWFTSLDANALVDNYELFKPLLQQAYGEIGYPDSEFKNAIIEAINVLLETPVPESLVQVDDDSVMYTYHDSSLEALPPAQKQLLRMGPNNIERIKAKLREVKAAFREN